MPVIEVPVVVPARPGDSTSSEKFIRAKYLDGLRPIHHGMPDDAHAVEAVKRKRAAQQRGGNGICLDSEHRARDPRQNECMAVDIGADIYRYRVSMQ